MFKEKIYLNSFRVRENDLVACGLLKCIDRYEQFAILYGIDKSMLNGVFDAALFREDYEICQVISEVREEISMRAVIDNGKV
jgi:hypothetical protein